MKHCAPFFATLFALTVLIASPVRAADSAAAAGQASRSSSPAPSPAPSGLLCNLLSHPEKSVLTDPRPGFCWIVNSARPNDGQSAYQVLVGGCREALAKGAADMWDSGKVVSPQSLHVLYGGAAAALAGKPLESGKSYWWAVRTWNLAGEPSSYSEPQRFNMGEFDVVRKWPGESRWAKVTLDSGQTLWTFEDRHPIAYHDFMPVKTLKRPDGSWFIDFGRSAFSALKLTVTWNPTDGAKMVAATVAVGEKSKGDALDIKPGGGIIYRKYPLTLKPGKNEYMVEIPRFKPRYPHSQAMPSHMAEVVPFRYCEVIAPGQSVSVDAAVQQRLHYQFDEDAAAFSCDNKALCDVYELCKYSVKANTFNGDYAASERERMMYEADSYIHQSCYYAVDREYALGRYATGNMIFHATWPTEWPPHAIFMAWGDYMNTGDKKLIARYYDELKPKTLLALAGPNGLISTTTGLQTPEFTKSIHYNAAKLRDIVDWPTGEADKYEFKEYNTVVNAFHYRSLVLMAGIAAALDKSADAAMYTQKAQAVYKAFNEAFFDKGRGVYVDGIGSTHSSLHANLFPLAFGLVPAECKKSVVALVKSKGMACSVYPAIYLLEGLYDAGEDQYALGLLTSDTDRSWLNMIRVGSTITTEAWDVKYKGNSGWTHAWSASPAYIVPRKLMGIEPLEPGFGKVLIRPRTANLTKAEMKCPTIRGSILVRVDHPASGAYTLTVTIPATVTATLAVPAKGDSISVTLDGKSVQGQLKDGYVFVESVGSGTHALVRP